MAYLSAAPLAILVLSTLVISDTIEDKGEDAGTANIRPSGHCHTASSAFIEISTPYYLLNFFH